MSRIPGSRNLSGLHINFKSLSQPVSTDQKLISAKEETLGEVRKNAKSSAWNMVYILEDWIKWYKDLVVRDRAVRAENQKMVDLLEQIIWYLEEVELGFIRDNLKKDDSRHSRQWNENDRNMVHGIRTRFIFWERAIHECGGDFVYGDPKRSGAIVRLEDGREACRLFVEWLAELKKLYKGFGQRKTGILDPKKRSQK